LFGDNLADDAPVRRDIVVVIVGVRGSGRSTSASLVRKKVQDHAKGGGTAWESFEESFSPFLPAIDPTKVAERLDQLKTKITKVFGDGPGRALVLIDNLPKLQFDGVLDLFYSFPKLARVFIVTTDDESLKERDFDAAGI
jgi:hypothetical protein